MRASNSLWQRVGSLGRRAALVAVAIVVSTVITACFTAPPAAPPQPSGPIDVQTAMRIAAADVIGQLPGERVTRLGINNFFLQDGREVNVGMYFANEFVSALLMERSNRVEVVERSRLEAALRETQYNVNQLFQEPSNLVNVGRFLPADSIAIGTMTVRSDHIAVQIRIFSTESGTIRSATSVQVRRTPDIDRMLPLIL